jgi:hypothetical protein
MTWFRREQDVNWVEKFGEEALADAMRPLAIP